MGKWGNIAGENRLGRLGESHAGEGVRERLIVHLHSSSIHVVVDPLRRIWRLKDCGIEFLLGRNTSKYNLEVGQNSIQRV